jgi:hypothetical protein
MVAVSDTQTGKTMVSIRELKDKTQDTNHLKLGQKIKATSWN